MRARPNIKSTFKAYLYLFPALSIIVLFSFYPIIRSFDMAFHTDYHFIRQEVYARGIDNFVFLLNDPRFARAILNTAVFAFFVVPIQILISLAIAVMLNSNIKGKAVFRAIYFLPFVTSVVAVSMVWQFIFHTGNGVLNHFLLFFGFEAVSWLMDPDYALLSLIIMSIWRGLGFNIVILLAGLQNVDKGLYLAARVDGAKRINRFRTVTLPGLSPALFFLFIMGTISSFRVFTEVFALFGGDPGPGNSALTIVFYIVQSFQNRSFGVSSAAAVVLFSIIFAITLIQMSIGRKLVHY